MIAPPGRYCDINPLLVPIALIELARFAMLTGFRFKGPYWAWRLHTALGTAPSSTVRRARAAIAYGLWIRKMRKIAALRTSSTLSVASGPCR